MGMGVLNTKVESQARECLRGEEIASERLVHEMAWREMKGSCEWSSRGHKEERKCGVKQMK